MLTLENNFLELTQVIIFSLFLTFIFTVLYLRMVHGNSVKEFFNNFVKLYGF